MKCQRCRAARAVSGERFCRPCRKALKAEMFEHGYLRGTNVARHIERSNEARENIYETKHGG